MTGLLTEQCPDINTCPKIAIVLDKDLLDFQKAEIIRRVCYSCPSRRKGVIINVNLDAKCKRCGKDGATENGYCMSCIAKMVKEGKFDHILKKHKPHKVEDKSGR